MTPKMTRIIIYTKHVEEMITFYERHFSYVAHRDPEDRIIALRPSDGGAILLLHPASKGRKMGQSLVKLVFDVEDVAGFCASAAQEGLVFGPIHEVPGYAFANAKDPSGNAIQVSSRHYRG